MSIPDDRRQQIADDTAELATRIANDLGLRYQGGTLIERMREMLTSELPAADANGSGGGSDISRPTERAALSGLRLDADGHDAWTPNATLAAIEQAAADVADFDAELQRVHAGLERLATIASRYQPRWSSMSESERAAVEEANRDSGCESCARLSMPGRPPVYVATWRPQTRVEGRGTKADEQLKERRRGHPLLTRDDDSTARLLVPADLCRGCYEHVMRNLPPGAELRLAEAIPLKKLRARLALAGSGGRATREAS